jgi:AraC-like DNA-binding protein
MMVENFNLSLLAGGLYRHTPAWNKNRHFTQCYKFYLPVGGEALVETSGGRCMLKPGNIYFVPGYHLRKQQCDRAMLAYWIHFGAKSFYLHHQLGATRTPRCWPLSRVKWIKPIFLRMSEIFQNPESKHSRPRLDPPLPLVCRLEAVLMYLVADLLNVSHEPVKTAETELRRLKPAIEFMDAHFLLNPSLAKVAAPAGFAPNYFHRVFCRAAGITPFAYMERRRLEQARRLLFDAQISIKEVAAQSGYENQLYFSRVFRRRFGCSPSEMHRTSSLLS